jgi:hypothetical protein
MISRKAIFPIAAAGMLAGCLGLFDSQKVAGNGSEVENAIVAGRVTFLDGSAAPATDVTLYPVEYDAMIEMPLGPAYTARTDSAGHFQLKAPRGTAYNAWGHRPADGLRCLIQDIPTEGKGPMDAGTAVLKAPGRLRVTLPEGSWEGGYLYVPGTPLAAAVDGSADSNGTMLVDSIPAGRLKTVLLARKGKLGSARVLGTDVVINPGATTLLPYTEWAYSAAVRVNASGLVSKQVTNVPLLLRLTSAEIDFSQARGDGTDLRFTKEDGTMLPCQVQLWDSLAATAAVWIKVDTVFADSVPRKLRMFWGNPRTGADKRAVFDTTDGYVGAWHLDAAPTGTVAAFADASPAGDPAKAMGILGKPDSMPAIGPADGRIGGGVPLNGKDSYLMASREYAGPSVFTASFWFRTSSKEGGKILGFVMPGLKVTYGSKTGNFNFDRVVWMTDEGLLHAGFMMRSTSYPTIIGAWQSFTAAKPYNDGQWHHLGYTLWDSGALLMVDGVKVAGYTGLVRPLPEPGQWRIGYSGEGKWDPEWTSEYFQGSIDEVRLSHQTRSEDWLRLDYESQKPGSGLFTVEHRGQ